VSVWLIVLEGDRLERLAIVILRRVNQIESNFPTGGRFIRALQKKLFSSYRQKLREIG
jgi:hypothetical protein